MVPGRMASQSYSTKACQILAGLVGCVLQTELLSRSGNAGVCVGGRQISISRGKYPGNRDVARIQGSILKLRAAERTTSDAK
jgi:hypothetical protein